MNWLWTESLGLFIEPHVWKHVGRHCYSSKELVVAPPHPQLPSSANSRMCFGKCEESHLGKCLLIVVFELLRIDVEMVLVDGEWVVVSGLLWDKLLHFHEHPLTLLFKRLHRNIRWCDRVWEDKGYILNTIRYMLTLMLCCVHFETEAMFLSPFFHMRIWSIASETSDGKPNFRKKIP